MTMSDADQKRLKELRREWQRWRRARPDELSHFDYCLVCPDACGSCDGCAATAYRAERCAEIEDEAARIKALHYITQVFPDAVVLETTSTEQPPITATERTA